MKQLIIQVNAADWFLRNTRLSVKGDPQEIVQGIKI